MTEDIIKDLRARLATAERERDEALETLKMVREIGLADEDGAATVESVIERVLRTSPSASAVLGEKEKWPHKACKTPDECRRECVCLDAWNCSSAVLGGDQTGATPAGWDERLSSLTTLVYPTPSPSEERYRQALKEIASADPIDLALDPTWPQRIADAALSPTQPEGGDVPSEPTSSALGNSDNDHTPVADEHGKGGA